MALTLTEELVRDRVNLEHDNLEDVKSLSLPGTYHEKIVSLGNALRKFSRLKNLDLSRNALETLHGIEHLKMLENLNLYYNNLDSVDELERLRHLPNLRELDLRLNPITRSEPDYRLLLIHMLPSLQKLDDRGVRDRERQAALIHFSSDQAAQMSLTSPRPPSQERTTLPRTELVSKLGKGPPAMEVDDEALLDMIARSGGDLGNIPITGSRVKSPHIQDYTLEDLVTIATKGDAVEVRKEPPARKPTPAPAVEEGEDDGGDLVSSIRKKYPNIAAAEREKGSSRQRQPDPNPTLKYQDELDAYSKYRGHGYFTQNPHAVERSETDVSQVPTERNARSPLPYRPPPPDQGDSDDDLPDHGRQRRSMSAPGSDFEVEQTLEELGMARPGARARGGVPQPPVSPSTPSRLPPALQEAANVKAQLEQNPGIRDLLFRLMDLVDRYWNGAKSLHKNPKFKGLALGLVQGFMQGSGDQGQRELVLLREQVERLRFENGALREQHNKVKVAFADSSGNEAHLRSSLQKAFQDVEKLKHQVQLCNAENEKLHRRLQAEPPSSGGGGTAAPPPAAAAAPSISTLHNQSLDEIQRQNDGLQREVEALRIRLKQYAQMQELAAMLQESHKSLVQTNDHLLHELDETRHRHSHEVTQMQWNYEQLKKTMSLASRNTSMASTNRSLHNGQASHS